MKKTISKTEAREKIREFFLRESFDTEGMKKIKKLSMKYNIKLGDYRRKFCGRCLSKLEGKTRVNKRHRTVVCDNCGFLNRHKL